MKSQIMFMWIIAVILTVAGLVVALAPMPPPVATVNAPSQRIRTLQGPDLFITCWRGLVFIGTSSNSGVIQAQDANGKPMTCDK